MQLEEGQAGHPQNRKLGTVTLPTPTGLVCSSLARGLSGLVSTEHGARGEQMASMVIIVNMVSIPSEAYLQTG